MTNWFELQVHHTPHETRAQIEPVTSVRAEDHALVDRRVALKVWPREPASAGAGGPSTLPSRSTGTKSARSAHGCRRSSATGPGLRRSARRRTRAQRGRHERGGTPGEHGQLDVTQAGGHGKPLESSQNEPEPRPIHSPRGRPRARRSHRRLRARALRGARRRPGRLPGPPPVARVGSERTLRSLRRDGGRGPRAPAGAARA